MITGNEIKDARRKLGKTQEQLADEIDISQRQLSRFENDQSLKKYGKFLHLVETLKLYKPINDDN